MSARSEPAAVGGSGRQEDQGPLLLARARALQAGRGRAGCLRAGAGRRAAQEQGSQLHVSASA
eukprot:9837610-Alexandrium_andersonii.AAC.1